MSDIKLTSGQADIAELKPHPRNYRTHPEDQLKHLVASLRRFGQYRSVVVSEDWFILAGHGIVEAAKKAGWNTLEIKRVNIKHDSTAALKILTADNEVLHLAERDDRGLTEILKELKDNDVEGLLATGYDDMQLAALLLATRPESEIKGMDAAAAWVGMPEYDVEKKEYKLIVSFPDAKHRDEFLKAHGLPVVYKGNEYTWVSRWPEEGRRDWESLRFKGKGKP